MCHEGFEDSCIGPSGWIIQQYKVIGMVPIPFPYSICMSEKTVKSFFEEKKNEGYKVTTNTTASCECCNDYQAFKNGKLYFAAARVPVRAPVDV